MNRRNFLKLTAPLAAAPLLINGTALRSFATPSMMMNCEGIADRIMVIIQMGGGNDGLNMTIPLDQYSDLVGFRPTLAIPETGPGAYITLDGSLPSNQQIGLHPTMTGIKSLYDNGKVNIVQGVGYPSQNRSHFKGTDLWLTGGDGTPDNFNIPNGWMGRYLDFSYPGLAGNPTGIMLDPLGIELGDQEASIGFNTPNGPSSGINLAQQDAGEFFTLVSSFGGAAPVNIPASEYGDELQFLIDVQNSTSVYAERISDVFNTGSNSAVVYPDTNLSNQLKTIARLINGGCQTKIYLASINGFDTHSDQVSNTDSTVGNHANLLQQLSDAVKAFVDDLSALGLDERVLTFTFSEFGRKVVENGSFGTDHGSLAPMMVFGTPVSGGVTGINPDVNNQDAQGALNENQRQFDYRQIYTTTIQDWLGASDNAVNATLLNDFLATKLPFVGGAFAVTPDCYMDNIIGTPPQEVQLTVILEGAYDATAGLMRTELINKGLVPTVQPFFSSPWAYQGTESVADLADFPADMVDWVLVEIRDAADNYTIIEQKAALLLADGRVVDPGSATGVSFALVTSGTDYFISVKARNHLAVLSNTVVNLPNNTPFDFTNANNVSGGVAQLVEVDTGIYGLIGGDFNGDGVITVSDFNRYATESGGVNVYADGDASTDGNVTVQDFNVYQPNASKVAVAQVRY